MKGCEIEEITLYKFNGRHYKSLMGARLARTHKKLVDLQPMIGRMTEEFMQGHTPSKEDLAAMKITVDNLKKIEIH